MGRFVSSSCMYNRKDVTMTRTAMILGAISVVINMVTMAYIETELTFYISTVWRLAILGALALLCISQLKRLRNGYQPKADWGSRLSRKLGLDLE